LLIFSLFTGVITTMMMVNNNANHRCVGRRHRRNTCAVVCVLVRAGPAAGPFYSEWGGVSVWHCGDRSRLPAGRHAEWQPRRR